VPKIIINKGVWKMAEGGGVDKKKYAQDAAD
jgi:hypothetical protein